MRSVAHLQGRGGGEEDICVVREKTGHTHREEPGEMAGTQLHVQTDRQGRGWRGGESE